MKKTTIILSAGFMLLTVLQFSSCTNKKVEQPAPDSTSLPTGLLELHLHNVIDGKEVDYQPDTITDSGVRVELTKGQIYLSHFQLVKKDGGLYTVPDSIVLKVQVEQYIVARVPIGNYTSIRFKVGLDSVTNSKNPSTRSNDVLNRPDMWFGSTAQAEGYIFLNVEGKIDTSKTPSASAILQPFVYKIGTNANLKQINMPPNDFSVSQTIPGLLHIYMDEFRLFNGIDISKPQNLSITTKAENSGNLAQKISNNIPSMFYYEP